MFYLLAYPETFSQACTSGRDRFPNLLNRGILLGFTIRNRRATKLHTLKLQPRIYTTN